MGLDGVNEWLNKSYSDVFENIHISEFNGKKILFDVSSYIYKYISCYGKINNKWLNAFVYLIFSFKKNGTHVIFVFDGKSPEEKIEERNSRVLQKEKGDAKLNSICDSLEKFKLNGEINDVLQETMNRLNKDDKERKLLKSSNCQIDVKCIEKYIEKRKESGVDINEDDIKLLKELLDVLKIPYIQAPNEAEATCNFLVKKGFAHATFSLDSDCIAYGVDIIINNFDVNTGLCRVIKMESLCEILEMDKEQITLFAILVGNDYNRHSKKVKGIGPATAYKLIKKWKTFDEIKKNENKFNVEDDGLRYEKCIELFNPNYDHIFSSKDVKYWDTNLCFDEIKKFSIRTSVDIDIEKIRQYWYSKIVFID